jgi:putative ABC transport system permease protein
VNLKNLFISAIRALKRNKMRSALTSIGIIIGVSSVIIMIGLGSSAKVAVRQRITNLGSNAMSVYDARKNPLVERDVVSLLRRYPQIKYLTPVVYASYIPLVYFRRNMLTRISGVNNDYFKIKQWKLQYGRYFTDLEIRSTEKVVIIGNTVRLQLFGFSNPLGKVILVKGEPCKVIGSLVETGSSFSGRDFDNVVVMPYTTAGKRLLGRNYYNEIVVSAQSSAAVEETASLLKDYFRTSRNIRPGQINDFKIRTSKEQLKLADYISETLSYLLAGIASISLFVGGVGIMNIMLVSVSERTREIGIRMAIGAKKDDVLAQFLIESITLSAIGGTIGIILGLTVYVVIINFVGWTFIFSLFSVLVSFLFSCGVGVFFGYYPARKAASLKPIDALRFE